MVGKVQKLAFHRILRFVISSFREGVMTILLLKGQSEFLCGQHLLMEQLQKLNCIISEGTGFRALYGWKDTEVSFPQNFTVCDFEFS